MAYRKKYVKRRASRRVPMRSRRSFGKRRSYSTKKRGMSRKAILNVTSRKKRDTMPPIVKIGSGTAATGAAELFGNGIASAYGVFCIPWVATTRGFAVGAGVPSNINDDASRTSSICYMKGLSETIRMETTTGVPWVWRRICFNFKGSDIASGGAVLEPMWFQSILGWCRYMLILGTSASTANQNLLYDRLVQHMFRGTYGTDYLDIMSAQTDTRKIDIKSDKFRKVFSGNDEGSMRIMKLYHGMNKNLYYEDTEKGDIKNNGLNSVEGKPGMGDYYVVDFFRPLAGATEDDKLIYQPQSTLYWHER
ncbi:MAG: capsid protein [Genomoviridae sp.]|nr:MAG: capsid protein [Genomoviridae sp.]